MKKIVCLLLLFAVGVSLVSCGKGNETGYNTESEWYLVGDPQKIDYTIVPQGLEGYEIRTPLVYETTVGSFAFRVDFFRETYPVGAPMQVRVTIRNDNDIDYFEFVKNSLDIAVLTCSGIDTEFNPVDDNTGDASLFKLHTRLTAVLAPGENMQQTFDGYFLPRAGLKDGARITFSSTFWYTVFHGESTPVDLFEQVKISCPLTLVAPANA